jgi:hypothetical protein
MSYVVYACLPCKFGYLVEDLSENHFVRKLPENKYSLKKKTQTPPPKFVIFVLKTSKKYLTRLGAGRLVEGGTLYRGPFHEDYISFYKS